MADEALAAFMDVTGCGYEDAFHRLASCGGHLGEAVNRFFNVEAGTSGILRSPPLPSLPQVISDSESDDDAARAPVPAARPDRPARVGGARGRWPSGSAPRRVSRWDSETKGGGGSSKSSPRRRRDMEAGRNRDRVQKKRRRVGEDDGPYRGGRGAGDGGKSSGRGRRFRDIFASSSSDGEEDKVEANNSRNRRRLNPKDDTSDGEEDVQVISSSSSSSRPNRGGKAPTSGAAAVKKEDGNSSSLRRRFRETILSDDDDMEVYEAPPPPRASQSEKDELFRVPHGLTYKGGFHDAVAHAARRCRWLLVNVQGRLDLASLAQNRDVWASDLVAQCVREHFVLWQADAGDEEIIGGEGEEATKVLSYYKIPRAKLPVVVVVDPVTGQAVGRLHGTDPNDFLVSMEPYTDKKPAFPVVGAAKKSTASAGAQQNDKIPAATAAPTNWQGQAPTVRKPAEQPVATAVAVAPTSQQPASVEMKVCKLRVRLPDGRVVAKEFGIQCAVAELFAYCRSEMGAGAAAARPFRLLRFVGAARVEIGNDDASFESLRLHMSTVCVDLS
ncbi:hypothetical protein SEVIR_2G113500v4 [Setaria viridis]|uniref:uncharacterized protein n=1 Tax=Setaria viridis TaxID=4556 RepID=UPI001493755A|nr:putative plant UBX domain-containing protein 14 [Setaria viridis]